LSLQNLSDFPLKLDSRCYNNYIIRNLISKNKNQYIFFFIIFISALFSYLVLVQYHFPSFGISLSAIILATTIYLLKKQKTKHITIVYILTLVISTFLVIRANGFLTFLNIVATIYLGSMLIVDKKSKGFIETLLAPPTAILKSLLVNNKYYYQKTKQIKNKKKQKRYNLIVSVLITIFLLVIIIPILSYANPIFNRLVENTLGEINLENIIKSIFGENLVIFTYRLFFFAILALIIPRFLSLSNDKERKVSLFKIPTIKLDLIIPKTSVSIILLIFLITQAKLYLSTEDVLIQLGYTHSQYAREVFAHLSVVSIIIFILLYSEKAKNKLSKLLTYLLVIEGVFLNLSALKSVYDYSSNWGFTYKRLYGFSLVAWIFGAYAIYFLVTNYKLSKTYLVRGLVYLTSFILITINVLNFDYIIYHFAKSTTHSGIDHHYLSKLSPDSYSYKKHLKLLMSEDKYDSDLTDKMRAASRIVGKIEYLRKKYEKFDVRMYNLAEYSTYKNTLDLDLEAYKEIVNPVIEKPVSRNSHP
jgi:hypothetical protein